MSKKIMILGAGILQLPAIQKAKEMGLEVIAVDMDEDAAGFPYADVAVKESTIDTPKVLEAARKLNIDGIMTLASDMPMRTVSAVSRELGLVGISYDTALKATNKVEMRNALRQHNVPIPLYYKASGRKEFIEALQRLQAEGKRCIAKPADNSGSRGVTLLKEYQPETIEKSYEYVKQYSRNGDVIVEEYMEGKEVSVETLSVDGVCHVIQITDKLTNGVPHFVEMGHNQPSVLDPDIKREIERTACMAVHAVGIENGPSHTEIKVTPQGPKVVELGARLGGDNITTHLIPMSTGIDLVKCCIKIALGEKPDIKKRFNKGAAIRYFESKPGKLVLLQGIEKAKEIKGMKQISFVKDIGSIVTDVRSSSDRIGFVIGQGENAEEAVKICEKALEKIRIEVEE